VDVPVTLKIRNGWARDAKNAPVIARKHPGWYVKAHPGRAAFLQQVNRIDDAAAQIARTRAYFECPGGELGAAA